jgi:glucokinase
VTISRTDTAGHQGGGAGYPWLVADIGGSNARFGWVDGPGRPVEHVRKLPVPRYESLHAAAEAYLEELAGLGLAARPRRASLALATAIKSDRIELTNSHWTFSRSKLQADLGVDELRLLNDFEALALSLPGLTAGQTAAVPGPALAGRPHGTLAVIGPGTGLGVGGVIETSGGWVALPGEGGHMTLAATNDYESELLAVARREFPHVSAERFLSGIGLPTLHAAVATVEGQPSAQRLTAEQIFERAQAGDAICAKTVEQFCAFLGSFAGSVALALGATTVYIGGGIVPRLGDRFFESPFRARFEAKGRFASYLGAVPCVLITDTLTALAGAAFALEQSVR